jgi:hypothetical protein
VEEFKIKGSYKIRKRQDREFFKNRFSVIVIFFICNNSNSSLLFGDKRLQSRRRGRGPNFYRINNLTVEEREVESFEGVRLE